MIIKFKNLDDLSEWMTQNGNRKQKYFYAVNLKTNVWTVSDQRIRASKNTIVRRPDEIAKCCGAKWLKYIGDAFGGLVCKSTVIAYFGREIAEEIPFDALLDNPYYKCSPPMKLYVVDRLISWAKVKEADTIGGGKLAPIMQSVLKNDENGDNMRISA